MTGGGGGGPWRNWAGLVSGHPAHRVSPRSEPEIQAAVRDAGTAGGGIAVAGSGHSFAPLVDPDGRTLISLDGHTGIESHDPAAMTVTVRAGTLVRQLNSELAERGLALPNQSAIAEQTVAGLVATASHGSSLHHGSLSSHLVGARVVTAGGEVREVAGADPELDAVRTHLGCLGVLSTLTFRVVPAFFLRKRVERRSLEDILGDLPALQEHEFGGFWWFPHTAQALVWWAERAEEPASRHEPASRIRPPRALMRASMAPPAMAGRTNVLFAALAGAGGEHAARSDLALLQHLAPRQQVLEYGVPLERTAEAVRALVRLSARARRTSAPRAT
jgi:FAD/FMN-containing dehydrogenase